MPFQSVPDCAQGTIVCSLNGVTINNTLGFAYVGGGYDQEAIDALAEGLDNWWAAEVLPLLSTTLVYEHAEARGLEFLSDLEAISSTNSGNGGDANPPMPALAAVCISFRTGFTGRSARGRNYVSGFGTDNLATNENRIVSSTIDALQDAYELLNASVNAGGWQHVVISRFTEGAARPTGVYLPVTAYLCTDDLWDTQRRRK